MKGVDSDKIPSKEAWGIYRIEMYLKHSSFFRVKATMNCKLLACLQLAKLYMVSDKEILTVKKYLLAAIDSTNICEESVEEASNILNNI